MATVGRKNCRLQNFTLDLQGKKSMDDLTRNIVVHTSKWNEMEHLYESAPFFPLHLAVLSVVWLAQRTVPLVSLVRHE